MKLHRQSRRRSVGRPTKRLLVLVTWAVLLGCYLAFFFGAGESDDRSAETPSQEDETVAYASV